MPVCMIPYSFFKIKFWSMTQRHDGKPKKKKNKKKKDEISKLRRK